MPIIFMYIRVMVVVGEIVIGPTTKVLVRKTDRKTPFSRFEQREEEKEIERDRDYQNTFVFIYCYRNSMSRKRRVGTLRTAPTTLNHALFFH